MQSSKLVLATFVAVVIGLPALAQAPAPAPVPAPAPPARMDTAPAPRMDSAPVTRMDSTTRMDPMMSKGGWFASKLKGVDVYNNANEKIGDISDAVIEHDGKISNVIISVGGFLGMGTHHVGIPFADVRWVDDNVTATTRTTTTTTTTANPPVTPSPSATTAPATRTTATEWRGYPSRIVVNMTKDQLKAAPEFKYTR